MEIKVSILDYLGRWENSVVVLLSLMLGKDYHEGIFIYTNTEIMISIDDELENKLGCSIEKHKEYPEIMKFLIKNVVPWSEIYNRIDEIDFSKFQPIEEDLANDLAQEIDPSLIVHATMSNI